MTKRLKVLLTILVVVILVAIGGLFYYQKMLKSSADTLSPYGALGEYPGQNQNPSFSPFNPFSHHHEQLNGKYIITVNASQNGNISPNGTGTPSGMVKGTVIVDSGRNITFTITPDSGYKISTLLVDGKVITPVSTYTFNNVTNRHAISVSFAPVVACKPATVVAAGTGPTKTVAVGGKFNIPIKITNNNPAGSACAAVFGLVVYPNAGWSTYGYSSNFYIPFKGASYRVINVAPTQSVVTSVTLNAQTTPATGTKITLKVDDYPAGKLMTLFNTVVDVTGTNLVTPTPVLTPTFVPAPTPSSTVSKFNINQNFVFTPNIPSGTLVGNISPKGTVLVNSGASQTFTFSPVNGYKITDVLVDGKSVGVVNTYTFSNVTANHTLTISFTTAI